jgi:transcriptional regulator with XRE-family HTH domain
MTGRELRTFRRALNLSQAEFGKILGVSRATIARAETMEKLSRIMTLSLDQALRNGLLREKRK